MSLYRVDEVLLEHRRRTEEMDRRWLTSGRPPVRRRRVRRTSQRGTAGKPRGVLGLGLAGFRKAGA